MHRSGLVELEAVMAVARRGGFRAAAAELGMSTSAVSNAIAGLEARLGARLFHRTTRSVSLTEAGRRYCERVAPALAEIQAAAAAVHDDDGAVVGRLRINCSSGAAEQIFAPLVLAFVRRHPGAKVEIVTEPRMIDIVAAGFDAGIRLADAVPLDMVAVPIGGDQRLVVVGSRAYFRRHPRPRTPDELAAHACIGIRLSHGGLYRWEMERRGQALEVGVDGPLTLDDSRLMLQAARAGVGLAFLSQAMVADDLARGRLVQVLDEWTPAFPGMRLYYPGHRHVPGVLRAFVESIRAHNAASAG